MSTFRFRLDRVLQWYREQCQIEEARLANCITALSTVMASIAELEAEREAINQDLIQRSSITSRELVAWGLYRLRAIQVAAQLEVDRGQRQSAVEHQRGKVQAARRRLRLLEKLRERRLTEHVQAEDRELENLAAEAFLAKWAAETAK
jgi:flagellar biosynthesis chaperone FliJ